LSWVAAARGEGLAISAERQSAERVRQRAEIAHVHVRRNRRSNSAQGVSVDEDDAAVVAADGERVAVGAQ
jgi:hypothetical protein